MIDENPAASWDDPPEHDDEARIAAERAAVGGDDSPKHPPGSILAEIAQAAVDVLEGDDDTKILQVGVHPFLRARYRPLADEVRDELQRKARARFRREQRIGQGHRKKGQGDQVAGLANDDPKVERYFDALLVAAACVEILVEDADGKLTPLQDHLGTVTPVRYTRELAELAQLDKTLGLDLKSCTPDEIATALHTWGKEKSTSALTSAAQVLKLWMGKVNVDALEEALGGR